MRMLSAVGALPAKTQKVAQNPKLAEHQAGAPVRVGDPSRPKLGRVVVVLSTMRMLLAVGALLVKAQKVARKPNLAEHQAVAPVRVADPSRPKLGQVVVVL